MPEAVTASGICFCCEKEPDRNVWLTVTAFHLRESREVGAYHLAGKGE